MEQFDAIDEEILNSGWEDEILRRLKVIASNQQNKIDFDAKEKSYNNDAEGAKYTGNQEGNKKIYKERLRAIVEQVKALKTRLRKSKKN